MLVRIRKADGVALFVERILKESAFVMPPSS